jgi:hypothetical protein
MAAVVTGILYAGCSDDEQDDATSGSAQSTSTGPGSSSSSGSGASGATGGDGSGGDGATNTGGTGPGGGGQGGGGGTGGTGPSCTWPDEANVCGDGSYCEAPGCAAGTCVPVPNVASESADKAPVCGCDGATYWNAKVAATHAMSVASIGECAPVVFCGGFANIQCPRGLHCNYGGDDQTICLVSDVGGACWGMPQACPMVVIGATTRACGAASCVEECTLVKQGTTFYEDATCPQ